MIVTSTSVRTDEISLIIIVARRMKRLTQYALFQNRTRLRHQGLCFSLQFGVIVMMMLSVTCLQCLIFWLVALKGMATTFLCNAIRSIYSTRVARLVLVDSKDEVFKDYNKLDCFASPIIYDFGTLVEKFEWLLEEL